MNDISSTSNMDLIREEEIKLEPDCDENLSNENPFWDGNDLDIQEVIECKVEPEDILSSTSEMIPGINPEIKIEKKFLRVPLIYIKKESDEAKSILKTRNIRLPYTCNMCNYDTIHKQNFKQHLLGHLDYKLFKCNNCSFETNYKYTFQSHVQQKHPVLVDDTFKCDLCDFKCNSVKALDAHKVNHISKRYNCDECNYTTDSNNRFEVHKLTHLGVKKFKCNMCEFETNYKKWLKIHLTNHTNIKTHKCGHCDYTTNYKIFLEKHALRHLDIVLMKCPKCEYKTDHKAKLNRHKRIYSHN